MDLTGFSETQDSSGNFSFSYMKSINDFEDQMVYSKYRQFLEPRIENFMEQELIQVMSFLKQSYVRQVEIRGMLIRQDLEYILEFSLESAILMSQNSSSRNFVHYARTNYHFPQSHHRSLLDGNRLRNDFQSQGSRRRYKEFVKPRLLSRIQNFIIGRRGQRRGQQIISGLQHEFEKKYKSVLEVKTKKLKQELERVINLICIKILEARQEKVVGMSSRDKDN